MTVVPGGVSSSVRWVIGSASAVTILLAAYGMQAIWECVAWVLEAYVWWPQDWRTEHSAFWYQHALALGVTAAIALAWLPRFRVSRLLRVAAVLPLIHLGAIIVAAHVWTVLDRDVLANAMQLRWEGEPLRRPFIDLPSLSGIGIAFAGMVATAIAIRRRHGEWAHATVSLALSFLLLLGLWLPIISRFAVERRSHWDYTVRVLDADALRILAILPAAIIAITVVAVTFRSPWLVARYRAHLKFATFTFLGVSSLAAISMPDMAWLVYLESSYLVMPAVVLAVAALGLLAAVTWLRSLAAHVRLRKLPRYRGRIAAEEHGEIVRFEITSWLRGPRLAVRPFVVTTPHGDAPLHGAEVLAPIPETTTAIEVGHHIGVLAPGDHVTLIGRRAAADGHPFRATDAAEIAYVVAENARPYRFSDVVLVVWRPAVAYLAILVAVATPYLTIFLTD